MLRLVYIQIMGLLLYLAIILINRTLKLEVVGGENYFNLKKLGKQIMFIFWHQATFTPLYLYRNSRACILTMKSLRGEILARAGELLGYQVTRIQEENDAAGLRQIMKTAGLGFDLNIAVDGPLGPAMKMKPGAIFLAKKLGFPILPVSSSAKHKLVLFWRWDKYFVALPFTRAKITFGEAIYPGAGSIKEICRQCEQALMKL